MIAVALALVSCGKRIERPKANSSDTVGTSHEKLQNLQKTTNALDQLVRQYVRLDGILVGDKWLWLETTNGRVGLAGELEDAYRLKNKRITVEGLLTKYNAFTTPGIDELKPGPWGPNENVPAGYRLTKARIIDAP